MASVPSGAMDEQSPGPDESPEFGPSGYLPERASRRARKIVLRAPLGLQWVVGSLVVGVVLVVAGLLVLGDEGPPPAPFAPVATLDDVTAAEVVALPAPPDGDGRLLVVAVGGAPRAFLAPEGTTPAWCDASGLLESADGSTWRPTGRGTGGTPSLVPLPAVVHDDRVHVDATSPGQAAAPDEAGPDPACDAATR